MRPTISIPARLTLWFALVISVACASVSTGTVTNLFDAQQSIERYIASGTYDTEFARVVGDASSWLEQQAKLVERPAIVLDIDETSLSNWSAYKVNGWARIVNGACNLAGIRVGRGHPPADRRVIRERGRLQGP